jgi:hypothetical protein
MGRESTGDRAPQRSPRALTRGSLGLHFAWDDTTMKTRIRSKNDREFGSLLAHFICMNRLGSRASMARISVTMPKHRISLGIGIAGNQNLG